MPERICQQERSSCHGSAEEKMLSKLTQLVSENKMAFELEAAVSRQIHDTFSPRPA